MDSVEWDIWKQADTEGGLSSNVIAEGTGEVDLSYFGVFDTQAFLQQAYPGADSGLGELNLANVFLSKIYGGGIVVVGEDCHSLFFSPGLFFHRFHQSLPITTSMYS